MRGDLAGVEGRRRASSRKTRIETTMGSAMQKLKNKSKSEFQENKD